MYIIYMHILDAQSEADNGGSGGGRVVASYILYNDYPSGETKEK